MAHHVQLSEMQSFTQFFFLFTYIAVNTPCLCKPLWEMQSQCFSQQLDTMPPKVCWNLQWCYWTFWSIYAGQWDLESHPPCSQIILDTYVCVHAWLRVCMCETVHCPLESATMLRVFPALWWGNAHGAWAPCLQGHMSFLSLWLTPTATETV